MTDDLPERWIVACRPKGSDGEWMPYALTFATISALEICDRNFRHVASQSNGARMEAIAFTFDRNLIEQQGTRA